MYPWYWNQSIDLHKKSINWFLYKWGTSAVNHLTYVASRRQVESFRTLTRVISETYTSIQAKVVAIFWNENNKIIKLSYPYNHTMWIPRWNDVETAVSTSFQRGIHVVCLQGFYFEFPFCCFNLNLLFLSLRNTC